MPIIQSSRTRGAPIFARSGRSVVSFVPELVERSLAFPATIHLPPRKSVFAVDDLGVRRLPQRELVISQDRTRVELRRLPDRRGAIAGTGVLLVLVVLWLAGALRGRK